VCVANSSAAFCEDAAAVDAAVAAMSKSLQWTMKVEEQEVGAAAGDVPIVTSVAGATKMDPGFKLFGKTIAVASAAAVYAFSDAGADAGALFGKRAVHGATAPICSQVCRSSPPGGSLSSLPTVPCLQRTINFIVVSLPAVSSCSSSLQWFV
jgi:hypothetical protein